MRLNCSGHNRIAIGKHLNWIRSLSMQNPEEVIRNQPQIAISLPNGCDLLCSENISGKMWQHILMSYFVSTLVGPHKELIRIFSPEPDFSSVNLSIGSYRLCSVCGTGVDSCVYNTVDGFCLKVMGSSRAWKLKREYELLKHLQHPGIVKCFEFICTADYAAMVMEELSFALGDESAYVDTLAYCHSQGFLHGDIRLNNLGSDAGGNGKLFDFGNASVIQTQAAAQKEIEMLKTVISSPIALERKAILPQEVSC